MSCTVTTQARVRRLQTPEFVSHTIVFTSRVRAYNVGNTYATMAISDSDELASIQATLRALQQVIQNHSLEDEYEELYLQYLPEEVQRRRDWWEEVCKSKKVKVTNEEN